MGTVGENASKSMPAFSYKNVSVVAALVTSFTNVRREFMQCSMMVFQFKKFTVTLTKENTHFGK